jgi:hypothetical protein
MPVTVWAGKSKRGLAVDLAAGGIGLLLVALAVAAGPGWADRHFLPAWSWSWQAQLRILLGLRIALGLAGLAILLLLRPRLVRAFHAGRAAASLVTLALCALAVLAAFAAAEGILRTRTWRATQEKWGPKEPLRARDPMLGWTLTPNHAGSIVLGGRRVDYATNAQGYRVRAAGEATDFAAPTIIFTGESLMLGYGLQWRETVPARVEALTGIRTANIAVNAFATDQAYMRLRREIGRFERPAAIVIPFVPRLFDRNLDRDRPHLDSRLRWRPARPPRLRLVELARRVVRYRGAATIDEGVAMTRAALRATLAVGGARRVPVIILVPQLLPESAREAELRRRVLDDGGLPYLLVPLAPGWRVPGDRHPDARGARAMAEAIAARLKARAPAETGAPAR